MLCVPAAIRSRIEGWARAEYPREACGLLIGRTHAPGATEVLRAVRCGNMSLDHAHERYELDPLDQLRAEEEAQAAGLAVVGVWHSHPDQPAEPSETDRAAAWEGWSYVILAVAATGAGELRSWRLHGPAFVEEALTLEEPRTTGGRA
jgi:proteasome lid subunit RPN8/RPN11